jgi:protein O-GlcNAc transferase
MGRLKDALASYHKALEIKPDFTEVHCNLLFALNYTASHSPSSFLEQARQYGWIVSEKADNRYSAWQCATNPERLRVGLVSGDFLNHPVGFFSGSTAGSYRSCPHRTDRLSDPSQGR